MSFVRTRDWASILAARGIEERLAELAIKIKLLPEYFEDGARLVWESDLSAIPVAWSSTPDPSKLPLVSSSGTLENIIIGWSRLRFFNGIEVTLPPERTLARVLAIGPALRALARMDHLISSGKGIDIEWPNGIKVTIFGMGHFEAVSRLSERMNRVSSDRASELTKSAYYMGSKYVLSSFLVEGIATVLPLNGVVVDLMCGAGSATRAFSLNWDVFASDAMNFCSCLASTFGYRGDGAAVLSIVPQLHAAYEQNMTLLESDIADLIFEEDALLHTTLGFEEGLSDRYAEFVDRTPRFPEGGTVSGWAPAEEVRLRREPGRAQRIPYCLILAYFGNVYFGLRQAMELDSLRFAVDQIGDGNLRQTALAALIATASYIGTGYASQFAQPVNVRKLSRSRLFALMERRAVRVLPEFIARLTALEAVAAEALHPVSSFTGTWHDALGRVPDFSTGRPTCVYLDAPYTRDEYSRYYHVLETLYRYHYPNAIGTGRVPDRKSGEIFRSPFFTRSDSSIPTLLSDIIVESLRRAEYCAWSYSSRARASIPAVVRSVTDQGGALVESFSVGHRYNGQGRPDRRILTSEHVEEYLLIFGRNDLNASQ